MANHRLQTTEIRHLTYPGSGASLALMHSPQEWRFASRQSPSKIQAYINIDRIPHTFFLIPIIVLLKSRVFTSVFLLYHPRPISSTQKANKLTQTKKSQPKQKQEQINIYKQTWVNVASYSLRDILSIQTDRQLQRVWKRNILERIRDQKACSWPKWWKDRWITYTVNARGVFIVLPKQYNDRKEGYKDEQTSKQSMLLVSCRIGVS
jgi:hypothetical protein